MFGAAEEVPQNELTRFHPRSPYGVAKVFAHHMTINYRESYGMFACSGILFNHEGWRRGPEFVTRKISRAAARIKLGLQDKLTLGNLDSKRDWGYAGDYVQAMHLMLQQDRPDDYVIGTGDCYSVRDFAEAAFRCVGLNWEEYVTLDSSLLRPAEVDILQADPAKARNVARLAAEGDVWRPRRADGRVRPEDRRGAGALTKDLSVSPEPCTFSVARSRLRYESRQPHRERRALAVGALDRQIPAHQSAEMPTDRQPQPGPTVLAPGAGLRLGERLEQPPQLLLGHPNPRIRHRKDNVTP